MQRGVTRLLIGACALIGAAGAIGPAAVAHATTERGEGARIALIGQFEYAQEAAAWRLVDGGIYDIDVGTEGVGSSTDLVLVTVSALDGPMPSMRAALDSLDGANVPRVAIGADGDQPPARRRAAAARDHGDPRAAGQLRHRRSGGAGRAVGRSRLRARRRGDPRRRPRRLHGRGSATAGAGRRAGGRRHLLGVPYPDAVRILTDDGFQPSRRRRPHRWRVSECYPGVSGSTRTSARRSTPARRSCSPSGSPTRSVSRRNVLTDGVPGRGRLRRVHRPDARRQPVARLSRRSDGGGSRR